MDNAMLAALREAVGAEQVADSRTARVTHTFDATPAGDRKSVV